MEEEIEFEVIKGCIKVNTAYYYRKGDTCSLIMIDLASKYICLTGWVEDPKDGTFTIYLDKQDRTINIDKRYKKLTKVILKGFKGWSIMIGEPSRYTVSLCIVKNKID